MTNSMIMQARLLEFLRQRGSASESIQADTDLIQTGLLDSMLLVELVLQVEQAFGVVLGADDVTPANFRNVTSLVHCIQQRTGSLVHKAA